MYINLSQRLKNIFPLCSCIFNSGFAFEILRASRELNGFTKREMTDLLSYVAPPAAHPEKHPALKDAYSNSFSLPMLTRSLSSARPWAGLWDIFQWHLHTFQDSHAPWVHAGWS